MRHIYPVTRVPQYWPVGKLKREMLEIDIELYSLIPSFQWFCSSPGLLVCLEVSPAQTLTPWCMDHQGGLRDIPALSQQLQDQHTHLPEQAQPAV